MTREDLLPALASPSGKGGSNADAGSGTGGTLECSICCDDMTTGDLVAQMGCSHIIHYECIKVRQSLLGGVDRGGR